MRFWRWLQPLHVHQYDGCNVDEHSWCSIRTVTGERRWKSDLVEIIILSYATQLIFLEKKVWLRFWKYMRFFLIFKLSLDVIHDIFIQTNSFEINCRDIRIKFLISKRVEKSCQRDIGHIGSAYLNHVRKIVLKRNFHNHSKSLTIIHVLSIFFWKSRSITVPKMACFFVQHGIFALILAYAIWKKAP